MSPPGLIRFKFVIHAFVDGKSRFVTERLWYDVTHGFGYKWKSFFLDLEVNHGLNPSTEVHIWLLHHLFLDSINADAQEWADAWNSHDLQIRGERTRSPRDIFLFSMIQDSPRGLERFIEPPDETEWEDRNRFAPGIQDLSDVPCEPPQSVFSAEQIRYLDETLAAIVDTTSRSMHVRKRVWIEAFRICNEFYQ
ncbi:hypothetical protein B0H12DRAFT_1205505 [Mycena haematopus]|nr:hypothetical protein B0H12DRAFT_1205505 [Mycena haematopus]